MKSNQSPASSPASPPQATPGGQPGKPQPYQPYVTYVLIGICVVMYLLQVGLGYFLNIDITGMLDKNNSLIVQGQVWRLLTPIFLHASILHIAVNMYALFFFGRMIERYYGRFRYLGLFILSGFTGNVISFMFTPNQSLGSSTSIFGLLGAVGVLVYHNREIFGPNARQVLSQVVIIAVINLIIDLAPGSGIDYWGHIGGLIGGTLYAWFGGPVFQKVNLISSIAYVNRRSQRDTLIAGVGVGTLFIFLTLVAIFMRRG
jgi:rhomboid protease GluP